MPREGTWSCSATAWLPTRTSANLGSFGSGTTPALCPAANPESFGLYFVLGVCFGLLLTLCLLVISISWAPRPRPRGPAQRRDPRSSTLEPEDDDEDEEDTVTRLGPDDTLPGPELSAEPDGPLSVNVFTSAEELERAQRLEERERILREIWRTGQPDLLGTGTLGPSPTATGAGTLGRMHYY
ncbi:protein eva-1 homolog B isoform X1 [Piliocolobus tephrosceles]|uniref:protein eva-1 homolog B isoform X1 n=1 Tax=Piliocolobus tephrosceles TaxID=591936 RepID=UPI000C2B37CE|nr:protein eva-1 homolog B isoform X1 [Piliocolobus tephrosceles]